MQFAIIFPFTANNLVIHCFTKPFHLNTFQFFWYGQPVDTILSLISLASTALIVLKCECSVACYQIIYYNQKDLYTKLILQQGVNIIDRREMLAIQLAASEIRCKNAHILFCAAKFFLESQI